MAPTKESGALPFHKGKNQGLLQRSLIVGALEEPIGVHCADLSTSVKFDTEVDQSILISFCEGAKVGAHWGRHIN